MKLCSALYIVTEPSVFQQKFSSYDMFLHLSILYLVVGDESVFMYSHDNYDLYCCSQWNVIVIVILCGASGKFYCNIRIMEPLAVSVFDVHWLAKKEGKKL